MGNVRVAAAYAGNALVYRLDDVQYTSDPYHAFIAEPGAMLGNRMAEWLERAGPFKTVTQPGNTRSAPYVLEATVAELYGDFRKGRPPAAVVTVQFALIDQAGARPKLVHERTIVSRVDLPRHRPMRWCAGTARRYPKSFAARSRARRRKASNSGRTPEAFEPAKGAFTGGAGKAPRMCRSSHNRSVVRPL